MSTIIYLVRNAQTLPKSDVEAADWLLSTTGEEQAEKLATPLMNYGIDVVYTSPFVRARQTVRPFLAQSALEEVIAPSLTDQKTAETTLAPAEFQAVVQKMWADENFSEQNCESNAACQKRICDFMQQILDEQGEKTVLISTHGQPLALFLRSIEPRVDIDTWANMQMPHVYRVEYKDGTWHWDVNFPTPTL